MRARWYNYKQLLLIFVRCCENAHASTNPHTLESMRQFPPARGGRPSGMCVHRQHGSVCVCVYAAPGTPCDLHAAHVCVRVCVHIMYAGARAKFCGRTRKRFCWPTTGAQKHIYCMGTLCSCARSQFRAQPRECVKIGHVTNCVRFFMFGRKLRASERAPLEASAEIIAVNNNIFIFMCWRAKTGTKTAPENYCFSQANTHTRARAEKAAMKCIFSPWQLSANVHRHSLRLDLFPALRAHVFRFQ